MVSGVSVALSALDQAGVLLKDYAGRSGGVLFNGLDTLAQGDCYVMGYNPSADENDPSLVGATIGASLAARYAPEVVVQGMPTPQSRPGPAGSSPPYMPVLH